MSRLGVGSGFFEFRYVYVLGVGTMRGVFGKLIGFRNVGSIVEWKEFRVSDFTYGFALGDTVW